MQSFHFFQFCVSTFFVRFSLQPLGLIESLLSTEFVFSTVVNFQLRTQYTTYIVLKVPTTPHPTHSGLRRYDHVLPKAYLISINLPVDNHSTRNRIYVMLDDSLAWLDPNSWGNLSDYLSSNYLRTGSMVATLWCGEWRFPVLQCPGFLVCITWNWPFNALIPR